MVFVCMREKPVESQNGPQILTWRCSHVVLKWQPKLGEISPTFRIIGTKGSVVKSVELEQSKPQEHSKWIHQDSLSGQQPTFKNKTKNEQTKTPLGVKSKLNRERWEQKRLTSKSLRDLDPENFEKHIIMFHVYRVYRLINLPGVVTECLWDFSRTFWQL